ncbi:uncharacterized protein LOC111718450 [Eurytemora carolleeae]|uniref:uncharacterized protein LOC111718450 n=1 Tax=Eurytemora carolleeae TaxID=1294199 RepID=UPI000C780A2D|nr:uncharacterized protein LOC111718450 [Eurytemora carolleeae]|eukprot:XP_023349817.1 uncharacterized protein LOC111718450 [Eurytemora affinis]
MLDFLWNNGILRLLYTSVGIQWIGCAAAVFFKTEKFYDLTGSATFILVSHLAYESSLMTRRQSVQGWLVFGWACRLGSFLFLRIMKDGEDKRFDKAKESPAIMFKFWTLQGIWVFITLLPTLLLNSERRNPPIGTRDYIGWGLWTLGFILEVVADAQKSMFKNNPENKGKFISSGLWSVSRHPNYFGEMVLWFGLYISSSSVFSGLQYLSVLSPIFVSFLISKLSGIPLLEAAALKKWGDNPAYKHYIENTPVLIPFIKT